MMTGARIRVMVWAVGLVVAGGGEAGGNIGAELQRQIGAGEVGAVGLHHRVEAVEIASGKSPGPGCRWRRH